MSHGKNKYVRDIQEQTKWQYTFCLRLVDTLGYGYVSEEIDKVADAAECGGYSPSFIDLGSRLNAEAKAKAKEAKEDHARAIAQGAKSAAAPDSHLEKVFQEPVQVIRLRRS